MNLSSVRGPRVSMQVLRPLPAKPPAKAGYAKPAAKHYVPMPVRAPGSGSSDAPCTDCPP